MILQNFHRIRAAFGDSEERRWLIDQLDNVNVAIYKYILSIWLCLCSAWFIKLNVWSVISDWGKKKSEQLRVSNRKERKAKRREEKRSTWIALFNYLQHFVFRETTRKNFICDIMSVFSIVLYVEFQYLISYIILKTIGPSTSLGLVHTAWCGLGPVV